MSARILTSQSLWSRDYFLIRLPIDTYSLLRVAIPLEQGLFFNIPGTLSPQNLPRRNPFGAGTIF